MCARVRPFASRVLHPRTTQTIDDECGPHAGFVRFFCSRQGKNAMNYRRLGRSGLRLSELSFGSWVTYGNQLDERVARECMAAAHDAGVNFFDNAEVYAKGRSESIMGDALAKLGWRRSS